MRKSYIWLVIAALLLIAVSVGVTVAFLVSSTTTVVSTFTIGGVSITMGETTGDTYKMTPGVEIPKDPVITVRANSESSWLFVEIEKENDFDTFCEYEVADGWSALEGYENVFYRTTERSSSDQAFPVLKDDRIYIKDSLTEEQLGDITNNPKLEFTAYASQKDGIASAADAWTVLIQLKEGES